MNLFYLQDSRGYVGNDVLWWAKDGNGYTTDLSKAEIYTHTQAQSQHDSRISDIPWSKDYIDSKIRPAVDMQYIKRDEALKGTGINIHKPKKQRKESYRCYHCGRFLKEIEYYTSCPNCDGENRP
jgi:rubrerythrin